MSTTEYIQFRYTKDSIPKEYLENVKNYYIDGDIVAVATNNFKPTAMMLIRAIDFDDDDSDSDAEDYEGLLYIILTFGKNLTSLFSYVKDSYDTHRIFAYARSENINAFFDMGFCFNRSVRYDTVANEFVFQLNFEEDTRVPPNPTKFTSDDVVRVWFGGKRLITSDMDKEYKYKLLNSDSLCSGGTTRCNATGLDWKHVIKNLASQEVVFVAEKAGVICGIIGCKVEESTLYIDFLCSNVNGSGSTLLVVAARFAKSRGLKYIKLSSLSGALSFYMRWSFELLPIDAERLIGRDSATRFDWAYLNDIYVRASVENVLSLADDRRLGHAKVFLQNDNIPILQYSDIREKIH